jgi:hypothetical protein
MGWSSERDERRKSLYQQLVPWPMSGNVGSHCYFHYKNFVVKPVGFGSWGTVRKRHRKARGTVSAQACWSGFICFREEIGSSHACLLLWKDQSN